MGPTYWHSDRYYNKPYNSVKIVFYLDQVTKDSGCLRVLPGTHNVGDKFGDSVQEAMPDSDHENYEHMWGMEGSDALAIPLESEPGDMPAFNHKIKHCTYGGNHERRMFTVSFQERHPESDLQRPPQRTDRPCTILAPSRVWRRHNRHSGASQDATSRTAPCPRRAHGWPGREGRGRDGRAEPWIVFDSLSLEAGKEMARGCIGPTVNQADLPNRRFPITLHASHNKERLNDLA